MERSRVAHVRAAAACNVVPQSNGIQKSFKDDRSYRHLVLPNKLQVLLVSSPDADKAAAAMCVKVGHFSDPDELPGLAHFCEVCPPVPAPWVPTLPIGRAGARLHARGCIEPPVRPQWFAGAAAHTQLRCSRVSCVMLQHMLFLGTKKYPDENSYSAYLNKHGGWSNAYTASEDTNYFFELQHEHLEVRGMRACAVCRTPPWR